jgi:hypothetical protein
VAFVELRDRLRDRVKTYGLLETLDRDHFYPKLRHGLAAIAEEDEAGEERRGADAAPSDEAPRGSAAE